MTCINRKFQIRINSSAGGRKVLVAQSQRWLWSSARSEIGSAVICSIDIMGYGTPNGPYFCRRSGVSGAILASTNLELVVGQGDQEESS